MAAICAVFAYHVNWINERREFIDRNPSWFEFCNARQERPRAPGLLPLFGERGVALWSFDNSEDLAEAKRLFPEAVVGETVHIRNHIRNVFKVELISIPKIHVEPDELLNRVYGVAPDPNEAIAVPVSPMQPFSLPLPEARP